MIEQNPGNEAARLLRDALSRLTEQTRGRVLTGLSHCDADDTIGTFGTDDRSASTRCPCHARCTSTGRRSPSWDRSRESCMVPVS